MPFIKAGKGGTATAARAGVRTMAKARTMARTKATTKAKAEAFGMMAKAKAKARRGRAALPGIQAGSYEQALGVIYTPFLC